MKTSGLLMLFILTACSFNSKNREKVTGSFQEKTGTTNNRDTATFGEGCFWCIEPIYTQLKGVDTVIVGFSGGEIKHPTYRQVSTGTTGNAEVAQIIFDPSVLSFGELLQIFWATHDPTTLNRQNADVGTQYRSVIFYHNEAQKAAAEAYKNKLEHSGKFSRPIVTEIAPFISFYPAENYHQQYYEKNPEVPYSILEIKPRVEKFEKDFPGELKTSSKK